MIWIEETLANTTHYRTANQYGAMILDAQRAAVTLQREVMQTIPTLD